ncbi:hypothetical protein VTK73DRAFT_3455 [Phialemonium thermophilum]|uniref:Uncharacterized protein n=1 Tax=Phialemonium thermophilum TaxID=223376 RepID=A0ABR3VIZ2_9PEZI
MSHTGSGQERADAARLDGLRHRRFSFEHLDGTVDGLSMHDGPTRNFSAPPDAPLWSVGPGSDHPLDAKPSGSPSVDVRTSAPPAPPTEPQPRSAPSSGREPLRFADHRLGLDEGDGSWTTPRRGRRCLSQERRRWVWSTVRHELCSIDEGLSRSSDERTPELGLPTTPGYPDTKSAAGTTPTAGKNTRDRVLGPAESSSPPAANKTSCVPVPPPPPPPPDKHSRAQNKPSEILGVEISTQSKYSPDNGLSRSPTFSARIARQRPLSFLLPPQETRPSRKLQKKWRPISDSTGGQTPGTDNRRASRARARVRRWRRKAADRVRSLGHLFQDVRLPHDTGTPWPIVM